MTTSMRVREVGEGHVELAGDHGEGCAPRVPDGHGLVVGDRVEAEFARGGFGEIVRLTHNGRTVLHRDEITRALDRAHSAARATVDQLDRYAEHRGEIESRCEALPEPFRRRIDKFVTTKGPSWWWEFGSYELSACADAVLIARAAAADLGLEPGIGIDSDALRDEIKAWFDADKAEPDYVVAEHGALTPLVGCVDYGCPHPGTQVL